MKHILAIDDEEEICRTLETLLSLEGYEVSWSTNPLEAVEKIKSVQPLCILLDMLMPKEDGLSVLKRIRKFDPSLPVVILTACDQIRNAVQAVQQGAFHYLSKPFDSAELLSILTKAIEQRETVLELGDLKLHLGSKNLEEILGDSPSMAPVIQSVKIVANTSANVLLCGESGTGKEILARIIHQRSTRRNHNYVPVDCASLPGNLIESLLFGYEQGSFTDAQKTQQGKLELAHEGTLFLDEIGNIPLNIQAKLLRFIETREVERIGSKKPIPVSIRLIAATNVDLKEAVKKGSFRSDLYHRLNEFPIYIPPLRERSSDIAKLCQRLLRLVCREIEVESRTLSLEALKILEHYSYPGNIRELKNILKRAAILSEKTIFPEHLAEHVLDTTNHTLLHHLNVSFPKEASLKEASKCALQSLESQYIQKALEKTNWHFGNAAMMLGVTPRTLYTKIRELQIKVPNY